MPLKEKLPRLPCSVDLESRTVLKSLPSAHAALAELKGIASSIPNQQILINTLGLIEALDSSEIENIITTHDDLFRAELELHTITSAGAKEVRNYVLAMKKGFDMVSKSGLLTGNTILAVQEALEANNAGYRKLSGTELKNAATGHTIYTPPQDFKEISDLMSNLEWFINSPDESDLDPLVKMAVIHYQFESIHPFYDGNGRTGRILNILYLVLQGIQSLPILFLSSYIIRNKQEYYRLLQAVREDEAWEEWLVFMIHGLEKTSRETILLVQRIKELMMVYKKRLRDNYKFYSQDLLNNLFKHPYTKIGFLVRDLGVSRITAANYLNILAGDGLLRKERLGTGNYYVNEPLFALLSGR
jgi:Fic family protein